MVQPLQKTVSVSVSQKIKTQDYHMMEQFHLWVYSRDSNVYLQVSVPSSVVYNNQRWKHSSPGNKIQHIPIVEYCSALKRNELLT